VYIYGSYRKIKTGVLLFGPLGIIVWRQPAPQNAIFRDHKPVHLATSTQQRHTSETTHVVQPTGDHRKMATEIRPCCALDLSALLCGLRLGFVQFSQ